MANARTSQGRWICPGVETSLALPIEQLGTYRSAGARKSGGYRSAGRPRSQLRTDRPDLVLFRPLMDHRDISTDLEQKKSARTRANKYLIGEGAALIRLPDTSPVAGVQERNGKCHPKESVWTGFERP